MARANQIETQEKLPAEQETVHEQPMQGNTSSLVATMEHHAPGSLSFSTGAGRIFPELLLRMPTNLAPEWENEIQNFCQKVTDYIYTYAANLLAQAVEINAVFAPLPIVPPRQIEGPSGYILFDTRDDIERYCYIATDVQPPARRELAVSHGAAIKFEPINTGYHKLVDDRPRGTGPGPEFLREMEKTFDKMMAEPAFIAPDAPPPVFKLALNVKEEAQRLWQENANAETARMEGADASGDLVEERLELEDGELKGHRPVPGGGTAAHLAEGAAVVAVAQGLEHRRDIAHTAHRIEEQMIEHMTNHDYPPAIRHGLRRAAQEIRASYIRHTPAETPRPEIAHTPLRTVAAPTVAAALAITAGEAKPASNANRTIEPPQAETPAPVAGAENIAEPSAAEPQERAELPESERAIEEPGAAPREERAQSETEPSSPEPSFETSESPQPESASPNETAGAEEEPPRAEEGREENPAEEPRSEPGDRVETREDETVESGREEGDVPEERHEREPSQERVERRAEKREPTDEESADLESFDRESSRDSRVDEDPAPRRGVRKERALSSQRTIASDANSDDNTELARHIMHSSEGGSAPIHPDRPEAQNVMTAMHPGPSSTTTSHVAPSDTTHLLPHATPGHESGAAALTARAAMPSGPSSGGHTPGQHLSEDYARLQAGMPQKLLARKNGATPAKARKIVKINAKSKQTLAQKAHQKRLMDTLQTPSPMPQGMTIKDG